MKIEVESKLAPLVQYGKVMCGDVFTIPTQGNQNYYMVIDVVSSTGKHKCVNLDSGFTSSFENSLLVLPVNAKVVIEDVEG